MNKNKNIYDEYYTQMEILQPSFQRTKLNSETEF